MANPTEEDQPKRVRQMKLGAQELTDQNSNIKLLCEWTLPYTGSSEKIVYAGFLEDINSNIIFAVTSDVDMNVSRIYLLTVNERSESERWNKDNESNSESSDDDVDDDEDVVH